MLEGRGLGCRDASIGPPPARISGAPTPRLSTRNALRSGVSRAVIAALYGGGAVAGRLKAADAQQGLGLAIWDSVLTVHRGVSWRAVPSSDL
jgi:hypothetical protein